MPLPFEIDVAALEALPEELQLEARARFAAVQRGTERNPLWGYIPHGKQRAYHGISAQLGAFVGGNRSGKSWGGTADDIVQAIDREAVPAHLLEFKRWDGECHWRVITPKLQTTLKRVVLPLFRRLIPKDQLWKGAWDKAYNGEERLLQLANGNTIDFLTHDMELDAFSGAELHGFRLDEEPKGVKGKAIYDESIMRLLSTGGDARMTFTPLFGLSWAYYELTARSSDGERGPGEREPRWDEDVQVVTVDMDENPHLDERAKRMALRRIPAAQRKARKSGQFVHFAGRIYPEWDPDLHIIPWQPVPRDQQTRKPSVSIFNWIDPGIDHPTSVGWFWIDFEHPEGRAVVFDTFKVRDHNVADVAGLIKEKESELDIKPRWRVIDPSARNRQHVTGRSLQDEYARHKIYTRPGQNSRLAGFSRVSELLKATIRPDPTDPHGVVRVCPRLVVMANNSCDDDDLPGLIEEFPLYRWRQRASQAGEGASPQEPIKVKDDHLDGLRYGVMSNPTGLRFDDAEDLPPDDPVARDEWERKHLLQQHLKRLMTNHKRRKSSAGKLGLAGRVVRR